MTRISAVCPKCGITKKSGKLSCCGRGGSWFGNCGSADNIKLDHTWNEGLHACKARARSKTVLGQQRNGAQKESDGTPGGTSNERFHVFATAATPVAFATAPMTGVLPTIAPVRTSANTSVACDVSPMNSTSITEAAITMISTSGNMPKPTARFWISNMPTTTPAHTPMSPYSGITLSSAPLHTPVIFQGCKHVLDTSVHIALSFCAAFFQC